MSSLNRVEISISKKDIPQMERYRLIIFRKIQFMTQVVVMQRHEPNQSYVLVESEAKNPLSTSNNLSWQDITGLSWLIIEENHKYGIDTI